MLPPRDSSDIWLLPVSDAEPSMKEDGTVYVGTPAPRS
jgi:hypothetical protein